MAGRARPTKPVPRRVQRREERASAYFRPARGALAPAARIIVVRSAPAAPDAAQLSIGDSGAGIPDEALARIFDPFYTTKQRGMGLGLSICRNIIGAHGGLLWAENQAGGGACFHLRLPLDAAEAP